MATAAEIARLHRERLEKAKEQPVEQIPTSTEQFPLQNQTQQYPLSKK